MQQILILLLVTFKLIRGHFIFIILFLSVGRSIWLSPYFIFLSSYYFTKERDAWLQFQTTSNAIYFQALVLSIYLVQAGSVLYI